MVRTFATGATRDSDDGKLKYKDHISPQVLERFSQYMRKHEVQADGKRREPGNWKKGMPSAAYQDSLIRHTIDFWKACEEEKWDEAEELACAMVFNIQGFLHERLRGRSGNHSRVPPPRRARRRSAR